MESENPISIEQWRKVIAGDPELEHSDTIAYTSPTGEQVTKGGGNYAKWQPKEFPESVVWFKYSDGVITTVFDRATLTKMYEFAKLFDANVYGDVGEEY